MMVVLGVWIVEGAQKAPAQSFNGLEQASKLPFCNKFAVRLATIVLPKPTELICDHPFMDIEVLIMINSIEFFIGWNLHQK